MLANQTSWSPPRSSHLKHSRRLKSLKHFHHFPRPETSRLFRASTAASVCIFHDSSAQVTCIGANSTCPAGEGMKNCLSGATISVKTACMNLCLGFPRSWNFPLKQTGRSSVRPQGRVLCSGSSFQMCSCFYSNGVVD